MQRFLTLVTITLCLPWIMGFAPISGVGRSAPGDSGLARCSLPHAEAYTLRELNPPLEVLRPIPDTLCEGELRQLPVVASDRQRPKDFVACGLYKNRTSTGSHRILDAARRLKHLGGNTLVFDAKDDGGTLTYACPRGERFSPSSTPAPIIEDLPRLVGQLQELDLHVVARVVAFKDGLMARSRPEFTLHQDWLNPAEPGVQAYLLKIIDEIAASGVDEIQLDYIRYPADRRNTTGVPGVTRPEVIADFLRRAHAITAARGVLLSMDMFGIVIWQHSADVQVVGQDIERMKPYVDIISPMLYPSHFGPGFAGSKNPADEPYRFVHEGIRRLRALVGDEVAVRPWLQAFPLRVTTGFGPAYVRAQIVAARDAGAQGWLLWSPGNHYNVSYAAMEKIAGEDFNRSRPTQAPAALEIPAPQADLPGSISQHTPLSDKDHLL